MRNNQSHSISSSLSNINTTTTNNNINQDKDKVKLLKSHMVERVVEEEEEEGVGEGVIIMVMVATAMVKEDTETIREGMAIKVDMGTIKGVMATRVQGTTKVDMAVIKVDMVTIMKMVDGTQIGVVVVVEVVVVMLIVVLDMRGAEGVQREALFVVEGGWAIADGETRPIYLS